MKDDFDPRLRKGIREFNEGLFFECHETLEEIWLEEHGEDRAFYQGIIQVAAGYFKWQQGVPRGAISLWKSGLRKLEGYGPTHLGVDLESFLQGVRENLSEMEKTHRTREAMPDLHVPVLSFAS